MDVFLPPAGETSLFFLLLDSLDLFSETGGLPDAKCVDCASLGDADNSLVSVESVTRTGEKTGTKALVQYNPIATNMIGAKGGFAHGL